MNYGTRRDPMLCIAFSTTFIIHNKFYDVFLMFTWQRTKHKSEISSLMVQRKGISCLYALQMFRTVWNDRLKAPDTKHFSALTCWHLTHSRTLKTEKCNSPDVIRTQRAIQLPAELMRFMNMINNLVMCSIRVGRLNLIKTMQTLRNC